MGAAFGAAALTSQAQWDAIASSPAETSCGDA
jgi:hypothetical protein